MPALTRKLVEKRLKQYGGRITERGYHWTQYTMPDGYRLTINDTDREGSFAIILRLIRERYGPRGNPLNAKKVPQTRAPRVDLEHLKVTAHASRRFAEMRSQGGITLKEIHTALTTPMRVMRSEANGSWLWVHERVTVAARENHTGGGLTITTILWTTEDLWEQHPRIEKAGKQ